MSGRHDAKNLGAELGGKLSAKIYGAELATTSASAPAWAQDLGANYYGVEMCNLGANYYGVELRV